MHLIPKGVSAEDLETNVKSGKKKKVIKIDTSTDDLTDDYFYQAMEKAYDPEINMVRDTKVDDSRLPFARNYYDFCSRVAGENLKMPFARQLWISLQLLGDICPKCTNPKAQDMFNVPIDLDPHDLADSMTLFEHGVCMSCGTTKYDCVKAGLMKDYNEAVWVLGQRSGKSTTAAMVTAYVFHRFLKSPKLSNVARGIQDFTPLVASFVALNATNAQSLLWVPVRDTISASAWYDEFFDLLDVAGRKMGKELYQFNSTGSYLRVFTKSLQAYPQGPSKRNLRGFTRVLAVTDELGHFPFNPMQSEEEEDERERANADEVHAVLSNSLATVRGEVLRLNSEGIFTYPQALNLSISSPASYLDKVMRLLKESVDSPVMMGVQAPTWEITPLFGRDHPAIVGMYRSNPRRAERDFGANPPALSSSVFDKGMIINMFKGKNSHRIVYHNTEVLTRGTAVQIEFPSRYPPSILSLDAGLVNNAFGLTLQYKVTEGPEAGFIRVPLVLEIVPMKDTKIDFKWVYTEVIQPIIKLMNVKEVYADRWNSEFILRAIEEESKGEIRARNYTLCGRDFDKFISFIATGQLVLPEMEIPPDRAEAVVNFKTELLNYPVAHLYRQFLTVQQMQGVLIKGSGSTDDIFRSLVLGVTRFFEVHTSERMAKHQDKERLSDSAQATVLVGGRSSMMLQSMMARLARR